MTVFLYGLGMLVLTLVFLLAVPLETVFQVQGTQRPQGWIRVRWLFGIVRFTVNLPVTRKKARTTRTSKKRGKNRRWFSGGVGGVGSGQNRRMLQRVIRLITDILHVVQIKQLRLLLRLGLGNPAETGQLWAFLGPLIVLIKNTRNAEIMIEPDFMDPIFTIDTTGHVRLIPLQLVTAVLAFVFSPAVMRMWMTRKRRYA